jgi:hypothetical protein
VEVLVRRTAGEGHNWVVEHNLSFFIGRVCILYAGEETIARWEVRYIGFVQLNAALWSRVVDEEIGVDISVCLGVTTPYTTDHQTAMRTCCICFLNGRIVVQAFDIALCAIRNVDGSCEQTTTRAYRASTPGCDDFGVAIARTALFTQQTGVPASPVLTTSLIRDHTTPPAQEMRAV